MAVTDRPGSCPDSGAAGPFEAGASRLAVVRRILGATRRRLEGSDVALLAAGLTFYAAIAVVPLLLVAIYVAGAVVGHDVVRTLISTLSAYAPEHLGFRDRVRELTELGAGLSPLALAAALIVATTYGEGLVRVFDRVSGSSRRAKGLRGRLRALALLATLPLLVLVGLGAVAVLPDLLGVGAGASALGAYLTFWVVWLVCAGLLAVTYRAFTPTAMRARSLAWGAAATGSFLAGMSLGWVLVLRFGVAVGQAYGGSEALGAAVLFGVYLFLVQIVCLVGYALTLEIDAQRAR